MSGALVDDASLVIVVGGGGVGKTTMAAALGLEAARAGQRSLVMTFDPSLRLKDTLGVGEAARDREVEVATTTVGVPRGRLFASLLDAKQTFDRLVRRHAPDAAAARRILTNRFYANLSGTLSGVLEYMAVERLFEVASDGGFETVVLDTPPTREALDFLDAPGRIVGFLDSGALRIALRPWFAEDGHLRMTRRLGSIGRGVESFFDRLVGLRLLRDMAEFFLAFGPLYDGFHERATEVGRLLRSRRTVFVLVTRPEPERVPETLFFARKLKEAGYRVGPVLVNMCHPPVVSRSAQEGADPGWRLMSWLAERDARGLEEYRARLGGHPLVDVPLAAEEPADLPSLDRLRARMAERWCPA